MQAKNMALALSRHSIWGLLMIILLSCSILVFSKTRSFELSWPIASAVSGFVMQTYFQVRIKIDQLLFRQIARITQERGLDQALKEIDAVLKRKYAVPAAKLGRPLSARIQGTQRILNSHWIVLSFNAAVSLFCAMPIFVK
jgi:glycogen synthase